MCVSGVFGFKTDDWLKGKLMKYEIMIQALLFYKSAPIVFGGFPPAGYTIVLFSLGW